VAQRDAVPLAELEVVLPPLSAGPLLVPADAVFPSPPEAAAFLLTLEDAGSPLFRVDAWVEFARVRAADPVLWSPHAAAAALLLCPPPLAACEASHHGLEAVEMPAASTRSCPNLSLAGCACRR